MLLLLRLMGVYMYHFFHSTVAPLRQRFNPISLFFFFNTLPLINHKILSTSPWQSIPPTAARMIFQKQNWDYAAPLLKPSSDFSWNKIHPSLQCTQESNELAPTFLTQPPTLTALSLFLLRGFWLAVLSACSQIPPALRRAGSFLSLRPQFSCRLFRERSLWLLHLESPWSHAPLRHLIYIFYIALLFAFPKAALPRYTLHTIRSIRLNNTMQWILVRLQSCTTITIV